jgi:hypothetical protein
MVSPIQLPIAVAGGVQALQGRILFGGLRPGMSLLPGLSPNDHDATVAHPDHDHPVGSLVSSRSRPGSRVE